MAKYVSKEFSILNARKFKDSVASTQKDQVGNSTILYAVLGRNRAYTDENNPDTPIETDKNKQYELWRDAVAGRKITSGDVEHVVPRYDWTAGTVYAMYRDTDKTMYERAFYVLTSENNVYKCLNNNKGATSTVEPNGYSTRAFTLSDGYMWKYMYTISLGQADKFLTSSHMPVRSLANTDASAEGDRQVEIQNAAANGSIEVIETVNIGSGYLSLANAQAESATTTTVKISAASGSTPSPVDNIYNGSSVYVISGTGEGQIRRVIDYVGATKTLTVNTAWQTLPNTDTKMVVSPTVTIIGDGTNAKAYSKTLGSTGGIANIFMVTTGTGYSQATVLVSANATHGTGATANVVLSPVGGHGKDAVRELGGDKLMLNAQFEGTLGVSATGKGYIPANVDFRSVSVLKNPILKVDEDNDLISIERVANTTNSPANLRLTTELTISYQSTDADFLLPANQGLESGSLITHERARLDAELGTLQFVTDLNPDTRLTNAMSNAVKSANATVVYIRDDETQSDESFYTVYINNIGSYGGAGIPWTKDDEILKSGSATKVATVSTINGPEANTYSGEFIHTENISKITRAEDQTEDIKIVLDF